MSAPRRAARRRSALTVALAVGAALAGCGDSDSSKTSVAAAPAGPTPVAAAGRRSGRRAPKAPDKLAISIEKPAAVNATAVVSCLQSHPETKAVLTTFNDALVALPGALARAGLKDMTFYGNGPMPTDVQAILDAIGGLPEPPAFQSAYTTARRAG